MLFSSQACILLFLPVVCLAYYALAEYPHGRLRLLLIASLVFYGWWDPRFVPLLAGSVVGNWIIALGWKRYHLAMLIVSGVTLNLLLLGVFKYANFFAGNLLPLFGYEHAPWQLVLPLGISFFTFQQITYLVDLRRGRAPIYRFEEYAAFVAFFPQLIAGPIVRHDELIPQFKANPGREGYEERLTRGIVLLVLGLIKKVLLADEFAPEVDARFGDIASGDMLGAAQAWYAALAYTLQLYFDFSAYSDMAIGLGLMFGFRLPLNFNNPYRSLDIRDFWGRWHMTLSRFLRDYVYIPLGGSRQGAIGLAFAVMITMLLCGLWHGAGWTFVVWGAAHGVAILINRVWRSSGLRLPAVLAWTTTMLFVIAGWVLFRAADFGAAGSMLSSMTGMNGWGGLPSNSDLRFLLIGLVLALVGPTNVELSQRNWVAHKAVAAVTGLMLMAIALRVGHGRSIEFIYFQF
jgi:alginate O-acetyltransferase complex protein AlgI